MKLAHWGISINKNLKWPIDWCMWAWLFHYFSAILCLCSICFEQKMKPDTKTGNDVLMLQVWWRCYNKQLKIWKASPSCSVSPIFFKKASWINKRILCHFEIFRTSHFWHLFQNLEHDCYHIFLGLLMDQVNQKFKILTIKLRRCMAPDINRKNLGLKSWAKRIWDMSK